MESKFSNKQTYATLPYATSCLPVHHFFLFLLYLSRYVGSRNCPVLVILLLLCSGWRKKTETEMKIEMEMETIIKHKGRV